jgi:hypothetical protein
MLFFAINTAKKNLPKEGGSRMSKLKKTVEPEKPTCEQCYKEIPPSVAKSSEGVDYIHYFCGTECYEKWQHRKSESQKNEQNPSKPSR